jgi:hypothetical protein
MFVFNRSAPAVILPLALLAAVVWCSNHSSAPATAQHAYSSEGTVARVDPPRRD